MLTRDGDVREGDSVLLEKKKENTLSPCYEKVMSRYGDQVVLRSSQGIQYKCILQHIEFMFMFMPSVTFVLNIWIISELLQCINELEVCNIYVFLRWLKTVSSTFQDVAFDGSLLPLFIS